MACVALLLLDADIKAEAKVWTLGSCYYFVHPLSLSVSLALFLAFGYYVNKRMDTNRQFGRGGDRVTKGHELDDGTRNCQPIRRSLSSKIISFLSLFREFFLSFGPLMVFHRLKLPAPGLIFQSPFALRRNAHLFSSLSGQHLFVCGRPVQVNI